MNISPEEAQASLAAIQQTQSQMRKLAGLNGYFLIIWGLVWFFGCLANQFLPLGYVGWIWGPFSTVGWILSAILGIYLGRQTRSTFDSRIGFFFLALFGFMGLWFLLMQPIGIKQGVLFFLTITMFGGVVAGIMSRAVSSIIGSLTVAALAVIGYYLLPAYFFLWVAIFCGLTMVGIGLVIRLRWR
jgi:hypothetical protein